MISLMRNRRLATCITAYLILFITSPAFAGMIPSLGSDGTTAAKTAQEMETIQRALETKMVQEKLAAHGLSAEEVTAKLPSMTPEQIHLLAQASDDVLAGGDGLGVIIALLVIVILVIVILKLLNKEIIIRMSGLEDPACPAAARIG
ncbi:MAG TPA: PA2779 family protein [Deltaproteobacteria bacterium]|nr:PA2779 family protein [Deltaproteobacteria bacterium]